MRRHRPPRVGEGTVWVVVDQDDDTYRCYWYVGPGHDRLAEHATVPTAADGVDWGRARTSRVRIRTPDALTYWAGTAPTPDGYWRTWTGQMEVQPIVEGPAAAR